MTADQVRVVDQHGRVAVRPQIERTATGLEIASGTTRKSCAPQIAQLLVPMLGEGNFSSEVQVELDRDDTTSARESYEKDGAVRSETSRESIADRRRVRQAACRAFWPTPRHPPRASANRAKKPQAARQGQDRPAARHRRSERMSWAARSRYRRRRRAG